MRRTSQAIDYGQPANWSCGLNAWLQSWWKVLPLWRGGGRWLDLCGRNHGTLTAMDPATDWLLSANRGSFGVLDFDGTDDYVDAGPSPNLNFTASDFSISFCFKTSNVFQSTFFFYKGAFNTSGYYVSQVNGTLGLTTNTSGASATTNSTVFAVLADTWQFFTVTRTGTAVKWYVNGVDVTGTAGSHADPASSSDNFRIGSYAGSGFVAGQMDDIRIYSRGLAASEVVRLYAESLNGSPNAFNRISRAIPRQPAAGGGGGGPPFHPVGPGGGFVGAGGLVGRAA